MHAWNLKCLFWNGAESTHLIEEPVRVDNLIPTNRPMNFLYGPTTIADFHDDFNATSHIAVPTSSMSRNEDLAKFEVGVLAVIFLLAVVGNIVVLMRIAYLARSKRMSRMNELIVHLSCADLFLAFFNVLPQLIWDITDQFHGGNVLCKFVKYVQVVAMYSSSYVLLITVIDRYVAICRPFLASLWTSDRTQILILAAWGLSFVFSLPQLFIFSYRFKNGFVSCWDRFAPGWTFQAYVTWFTFAIYVIPSLIITCLYSRVLLAVRRSGRSGETTLQRVSPFSAGQYCKSQRRNGLRSLSTSTDTSTKMDACESVGKRKKSEKEGERKYQQLSRAIVKTTRFTLTVIFSYLICWGPFFFSMLWRSWDKSAPVEAPLMVIANLLAGLNSCTNPWLYMAFNCRRLPWPSCCCCCCCCFCSKAVRPVHRRTTGIEQ